MRTWQMVLLAAAPVIGATVSSWESGKRGPGWHLTTGWEMVFGAMVMTMLAAAIVLGSAVITERRTPGWRKGSGTVADWWPAPAVGMFTAFVIMNIGWTAKDAQGGDIFLMSVAVGLFAGFIIYSRVGGGTTPMHKNVAIGAGIVGAVLFLLGWPIGLYTMIAVAIWYVLSRQSGAPLRMSADSSGLPVAEWTDEYAIAQLFGSRRAEQIRRRCSIKRGADGALLFIIESVTDDSGRFLPFGGVIASDTLRATKRALGLDNRAPEIDGCPWSELQAFVLTNANERFNQRGEKPDQYIIADMGSQWGEAYVSSSGQSPAIVSSLHRKLTQTFIHERPQHMKRLAAEERQVRNAAAGEREKII